MHIDRSLKNEKINFENVQPKSCPLTRQCSVLLGYDENDITHMEI